MSCAHRLLASFAGHKQSAARASTLLVPARLGSGIFITAPKGHVPPNELSVRTPSDHVFPSGSYTGDCRSRLLLYHEARILCSRMVSTQVIRHTTIQPVPLVQKGRAIELRQGLALLQRPTEGYLEEKAAR